MALRVYAPLGRGQRPTMHVDNIGHRKPAAKTGRCAVIVAAYHAKQWIEDCVRSIRAQRMPDGWTLDLRIGVDGCKQTAAVLDRMKVPYFWSEKNVGTYIMRNSLIGIAPADCYAIFDADDIMLEGYLLTLIRGAGLNGIAGAARRTINAVNQVFQAPGGQFSSGVCVISATAMQKVGGYQKERIASDADLISRARLLGVPIDRVRAPLYLRRKHIASLTQAPGTKFGSKVRSAVIMGHKALRTEGVRFVEPVVTPLVWSDGATPSDMVVPTDECVVVAKKRAFCDLRHSVYTRIKYQYDEALTKRADLLKLITAPAMAAQRNIAPVRWVFFCHERHCAEIETAARAGGWTGIIAFNERDDTEEIQTTLDSDDWISPDWLSDVQCRFNVEGEPEIIYWQPLRYQLSSGRWYSKRVPATWPSMFYSVYRPTDEVHVYAAKHPQLDTLGCKVTEAGVVGMVALTIHGRNVNTRLRGNEVRTTAPHGAAINPEAKKYAVDAR